MMILQGPKRIDRDHKTHTLEETTSVCVTFKSKLHLSSDRESYLEGHVMTTMIFEYQELPNQTIEITQSRIFKQTDKSRRHNSTPK